jgi:hypothetical protein
MAEAVIAGMRRGVAHIRERIPGVRIIGATVTTALGSSNPAHGSPEQDVQRKILNDFIRSGGVFDGVADFDRATLDPTTGGMRAEFVPESTTGGPGDKLHPNRAGYEAMAATIDLAPLIAEAQRSRLGLLSMRRMPILDCNFAGRKGPNSGLNLPSANGHHRASACRWKVQEGSIHAVYQGGVNGMDGWFADVPP